MMRHALCFIFIGLLFSSVVIAQTDSQESNKFFEEVFGAEFKRAVGTSSPDDNFILAETLLGAVAQSAGNPAVQRMLCDKAGELTEKHVKGADIALKALALLIEISPDTALETNRRIVAVHHLRYSRTARTQRAEPGQAYIDALRAHAEAYEKAADYLGAMTAIQRATPIANDIRWDGRDQLKTELDRLAAAQKSNKKLNDLKARIKANPDDSAAAHELVTIYLVDLDQPAEAAKFALQLSDDDLKQNILLAVTPLEELTESQAMHLGEWYKSLGTTAKTKAARLRMFELSKACFEHYLDVHTAQDLKRTKAKLLVLRLGPQIEALQRSVGASKAGSPGRSRFSSGVIRFVGKPIELEAERAGKIVGDDMKIYKDGRVAYLSVKQRRGEQGNQTSSPSNGRLLIVVQTAKATQIRLYGYINTPSAGSGNNSFFVAVVAGKHADARHFNDWEGPNQPEWTWVSYKHTIQLAAGFNTIIIAGREDGAMIDKIRITPPIER